MTTPTHVPTTAGTFAVHFRPNAPGARWRVVGRADARDAALVLMHRLMESAVGDWRVGMEPAVNKPGGAT